MTRPVLNLVLLLDTHPEHARITRVLIDAGLDWMAFAAPAQLAAAITSTSIPAAALVAAALPAATSEQWSAVVREGPGLWASTPLIAITSAEQPAELRARLEESLGPLAMPSFRDPESAAYRLVRLVGLDQARRLLASLADTLREAVALAGTGPVPAALAHRLAGLAGLYGYAALGQSWKAVELGESGAPGRALAMTRKVLAELEHPAGGEHLLR